MDGPSPPADESAMHRWFGVTLNNRTWDSLDLGTPSAESSPNERETFLYGAYASAYHWREVGGPAHQIRGEHLLSRTALRVGDYDRALHHARRGYQLAMEHQDALEDWDLPFVLEALARALAASGDLESAHTRLTEAQAATSLVAEAEERRILQDEIGRGEWFGLK